MREKEVNSGELRLAATAALCTSLSRFIKLLNAWQLLFLAHAYNAFFLFAIPVDVGVSSMGLWTSFSHCFAAGLHYLIVGTVSKPRCHGKKLLLVDVEGESGGVMFSQCLL